MLGFKIFDRDTNEDLNKIFELCLKDNLAIEVALYNDQVDSFIERMNNFDLYQKLPQKSIHLNYKHYLVNNIQEKKYYDNCLYEINLSKKLGINKGVIHYQSPSNFKIHLENFTQESIRKNLNILYEIAEKENFIFYIENTFIYKMHNPTNNLNQHRLLWDTILELNFQDKIGICLDWGHVKAFTTDSLTSWLNYVQYLKQNGFHVYMHVHDNNGKKDQHLSFKESEELNLSKHNHKDDIPFVEILNTVQNQYLNDSLILEYNSQIAIEHYWWTREKMETLKA